MAKKSGKTPAHVKIARKAYQPVAMGGDPFWNKVRSFSEWEAWEYIVAKAAWADHPFSLRSGKVIGLSRGETPPLAVRYLMTAWGWGSKKRVMAFLSALRDLERLRVQQSTADGDTYFLVNYNFYQGGGDSDVTDIGDAGGYAKGTQAGTKHKHIKAEITNTDLLFETIWLEYPRKVGKQDALKAWNKLIVRGDPKAIEAGILRYAAYVKANNTEQQFTKHLSTLLNSGGWQDDWTIEGVVPIRKEPQEWWETERVV